MSRRRKGEKRVVTTFREQLVRLQALASDYGVTVRVHDIRNRQGQVRTAHVLFDDVHGKRLLDYWPGTGRIWIAREGKKGKVADCWAALDEAVRVAATPVDDLDDWRTQADNHLSAINRRAE